MQVRLATTAAEQEFSDQCFIFVVQGAEYVRRQAVALESYQFDAYASGVTLSAYIYTCVPISYCTIVSSVVTTLNATL